MHFFSNVILFLQSQAAREAEEQTVEPEPGSGNVHVLAGDQVVVNVRGNPPASVCGGSGGAACGASKAVAPPPADANLVSIYEVWGFWGCLTLRYFSRES